jgi:hypothetical protein
MNDFFIHVVFSMTAYYLIGLITHSLNVKP